MRKNYSSDREKLLKFEDEGQEFANVKLEQYILTMRVQTSELVTECFFKLILGGFSYLIIETSRKRSFSYA